MVTLATGPVLSRGALLGQQVGGALGQSLGQGATDRFGEIELIKQYDPVRQVLAERLGQGPASTPGQQLLQGLTQDPLAFAKAMEDPQTIAALTGTANMAAAPQVEEDPVDKAIRFITQAETAAAQGDTIRPPLLRARAAQLLDMKPGEGPNLDMFVATVGGESIPVQRDPKSGTFKDLNGGDITLDEGTQIFELSKIASGGQPREMRNDPNGVLRYVDTQEAVFPGVESEQQGDREMREDPNGILRFVDTQEPVFPGVEREQEGAGGDAMSATFAVRAGQSNETLSLTGDQFTGAMDRLAGFTPQGLRGEARQLFDQASKNFITAVLRKESGAQINASEFADAAEVYTPQPGDKEAVLQQKAASRAAAIAGLEVAAGSALEEVRNAPINATVKVGDQEYLVGTIITNSQRQRGVVQHDGTIQVLE